MSPVKKKKELRVKVAKRRIKPGIEEEAVGNNHEKLKKNVQFKKVSRL